MLNTVKKRSYDGQIPVKKLVQKLFLNGNDRNEYKMVKLGQNQVMKEWAKMYLSSASDICDFTAVGLCYRTLY